VLPRRADPEPRSDETERCGRGFAWTRVWQVSRQRKGVARAARGARAARPSATRGVGVASWILSLTEPETGRTSSASSSPSTVTLLAKMVSQSSSMPRSSRCRFAALDGREAVGHVDPDDVEPGEDGGAVGLAAHEARAGGLAGVLDELRAAVDGVGDGDQHGVLVALVEVGLVTAPRCRARGGSVGVRLHAPRHGRARAIASRVHPRPVPGLARRRGASQPRAGRFQTTFSAGSAVK
jgi:hypothetical protein